MASASKLSFSTRRVQVAPFSTAPPDVARNRMAIQLVLKWRTFFEDQQPSAPFLAALNKTLELSLPSLDEVLEQACELLLDGDLESLIPDLEKIFRQFYPEEIFAGKTGNRKAAL